MEADSQRHDDYGDDGNFPEIAATLQSRQAERFDDVQSHQKDKQHRQNFGHGDTSPPPCDAGACKLQALLSYALKMPSLYVLIFILSPMDEG